MASRAARKRAKREARRCRLARERELVGRIGWPAYLRRLDESEARQERARLLDGRVREVTFTDVRFNADLAEPRRSTGDWLSKDQAPKGADLATPTARMVAVYREARAESLEGRRLRPWPGAGSAQGRKGGGA